MMIRVSRKWRRFINNILTGVASILALAPLYILERFTIGVDLLMRPGKLEYAVHKIKFNMQRSTTLYSHEVQPHDKDVLADVLTPFGRANLVVHEYVVEDNSLEGLSQNMIILCEYIEPSPAIGGTTHEVERFVRHLEQTHPDLCEEIQLIGQRDKKKTKELQDLTANSYVCVGGKMGIRKQDCLVYSFGIKHPWVRFSELVEKELGCNVSVFEPAADFIDHYHSKKIRFFNARLSDIDQQAQYKVPGRKGWKYRRFLTIIKEHYLSEKPIDLVRLDASLDLWKGMSTMLQDGSLSSFVKQLTLEYDMDAKTAEEVREMFGISQWLQRQGFLLVHSQATRTSRTSYGVTYINSKTDTVS